MTGSQSAMVSRVLKKRKQAQKCPSCMKDFHGKQLSKCPDTAVCGWKRIQIRLKCTEHSRIAGKCDKCRTQGIGSFCQHHELPSKCKLGCKSSKSVCGKCGAGGYKHTPGCSENVVLAVVIVPCYTKKVTVFPMGHDARILYSLRT